MKELDYLFRPRSIAVIGASERPLTIGNRIPLNIKRHGFTGRLYLVNPKGGKILEDPVYKSIGDVDGDVDLAHVIVKNTLVTRVIEECADKGVKVAIVNTSGFKEIGGEGVRLEEELVQTAKKRAIRIFGPNCQGVMNTDPSVSLYSNFTFARMSPGHVSIVAQGGGVAEVINNYFGMNGVGQRMYASNGNACDISIPEIVEYYGEDDGTHVVVLHLESFADPAEFLERVGPVAKRKPVLALKSGITEEGARAVSSHTGGLMQEDRVTDALFDKAGVLRFRSLPELCDAAQAFATGRMPRGRRVGMVTNAGSPAIIVTDEAVKAGLEVPDLSPRSKEFLKEKLQSIASIANPIDMMATASGEEFGASLQTLLEDPNVDSAVVCFMTPFFVDTLAIARSITQQKEKTEKLVIAVAMTNPDEKEEWRETVALVREAGVPVYYFPESAARVLYHMERYRKLRERPRIPAPPLDVDSRLAARLIEEAAADGEGFVAPAVVEELLRCYSIPLVEQARVESIEEALRTADAIGYPVVLKAERPGLVHKTEAGAVAVGIRGPEELEERAEAMVERLGPGETSWLVQREISDGLEVIVGASRAAGFGAMVMFGLGGVHVEVLEDVVFKLAPLTLSEAEEMTRSIRAADLLEGARGAEPIDRGALVEVILKVSRMVTDLSRIAELDLNPIFIFPRGREPAVADARIRVAL